jgi:hypothetical protein
MNLSIESVLNDLGKIITVKVFIFWSFYSSLNLIWDDIDNQYKHILHEQHKVFQIVHLIQIWVFIISIIINWIILILIGIKISFVSSILIWIGTGLAGEIIFSFLYRYRKMRKFIEYYFPILTIVRILGCLWFIFMYYPLLFK